MNKHRCSLVGISVCLFLEPLSVDAPRSSKKYVIGISASLAPAVWLMTHLSNIYSLCPKLTKRFLALCGNLLGEAYGFLDVH